MMAKFSQFSSTTKKNPAIFALVFASIISLYFNSKLADPFNAPKLWLLILAAAWLSVFAIITNNRSYVNNKEIKLLILLNLLFQLAAIFALLFTDIKFIAFFGDQGRKIGFITYLSFSIFMITAAKYTVISTFKNIYNIMLVTASLFVIYGLMQHFGKDFIKWSNPYNSIIGTLGNPNFASAFMAVFVCISFSLLFIKSINTIYKLFGLFLTLTLCLSIFWTNARQGILAAGAGIGFFVCALIFVKSKKLGYLAFITLIFLALLVILGMLQIGPAEHFVYKPSVSVRGYYWRAGLNMLQHNPLTGIGLDRYGAYFKQYQEVGYGLNVGFDITSTNAHNIPIQIFATGGLFLGLAYLLITGYIFYRAIISINKFKGDEQVFFLGLIAAWIAFEAQSIVSIENIGLGVWGWILGGLIVGLSLKQSEFANRNPVKTNSISFQPIAAFLVFVLALIPVSILVKAETTIFRAQINYNPNSTDTVRYAQDVLNSKWMDPDYKYQAANMLLRANGVEQGIGALEDLVAFDPRNNNYILVLAQALEVNGKFDESIKLREQLKTFDPNNVKNYLQLGRLYKQKGDIVNAQAMLNKILSFAPNTPQAQAAKTELAF